MSLAPDDIAALLTKSAGYDPAHTPRNSAILTGAWLEHFDRYAPMATRAQMLEAVTEYHREPHDRMLQPGDLTTIIRSRHRDQIDRADQVERGYPGDAKAAPDLPDYPADWTAEQRMTAYWYVIRERRTWPAMTDNWRTILHLAQRPRASTEADA